MVLQPKHWFKNSKSTVSITVLVFTVLIVVVVLISSFLFFKSVLKLNKASDCQSMHGVCSYRCGPDFIEANGLCPKSRPKCCIPADENIEFPEVELHIV